ncbi:MAG: cytochrome b N-terminal domain-containing protein [Candidatus Omnitrophica bacterium]|nr:cytochrome b N-terminal domain-containing protein [Candidatus Omnitrophota bacterium]MDE2009724.1 cytochrome b N-terminal domain-containing protein [Candidatus Omnitrophota bacterium]MDE2213879.1 cytochrome b N-terminal domain-containing protein [Candidatus Omnitrophota bacterium]MDE2231862.1 cytochrome b N-terminal domain-containing protein [Candidatus Omnitrophota bacterium]
MSKKKWLHQIKDWVDERTGLIKAGAEFLHEEIPGGTRFSYTLGSACLFLLTLQIVTGIWQLFYYVPTIDYAYSSLNYLRLQVPYGWLIHGIHYWGGTLFTIVVGLHCLRVFIWGSYKKPREMVWLMGIVLIILTALFMFTGPVLPWDKNGYWAGQVGIGIAGTVPIVGPLTQMLMQGADKMGQMALLRMYVMHVALLPGAIALFVILHLVAFRKYGESGPWDKKKRGGVGYFWPEQIFKDVLVSLLIFLLLVYLSAFHPAPFSGLADPMDTLVTPKPAWNFLFLYQLLKLKIFSGPFEPLGTAGIPTLFILLFASLPFVDKSPERNPFKRGFVVLSGFAFVGMILYLTWLGYSYTSPAVAAQKEQPNRTMVTLHHKTQPPMDLQETMLLANANKKLTGKKLFHTLGCTECHTITGKPSNKQGPDLIMAKSNNRTRAWLYEQIVSPQSHNPRTIMPPFSDLSHKNVELLINFLDGLKAPKTAALPPPPPASTAGGTAAGKAAAIKYGEQLFNTVGCTQCHTIQGRPSNKVGPDLIIAVKKSNPSKDWLKTQLTDPQAHNPMSIMPSFSSRLNDTQMNAVIVFLKSLSTRKAVPLPAGVTETSSSNTSSSSSFSSNAVYATNIIGDKDHGAILFHQSCIMCHGPHGNPKTPGFNAPKGVPPLNPIDPHIFNADPQAFVDHINTFIQHGAPNIEGGPKMPNFGDSNALTQAQIADLEAYVLSLNGVDRTMIMNPGIQPKVFFYTLLWITSVIIMLAAVYWFVIRTLKI